MCLIVLERLLAVRSASERGRKARHPYNEEQLFSGRRGEAYGDLVEAASNWPSGLSRTLFDGANWVPGVIKPRIVLTMEITSKDNFSLTWRPETYIVDGVVKCDFIHEPRTWGHFDRPPNELLFIHDVGRLRIDIPSFALPPDPARRQLDGFLVWVLSRIVTTLLLFLRERCYVRVEHWLEVVEALSPAENQHGQRQPLLSWRIYDVEARQLAEDQRYEAHFEVKHGIHQDDLLEVYANTAGTLDRSTATSRLLRRRGQNITPARVRDSVARLEANAARRRRADHRSRGLPVEPEDSELEQPRVYHYN